MAQVIGKVKSFESGKFFVKDDKGHIQQLNVGNFIHQGEHVYGASTNTDNAKIVIDVMLPTAGDLVIIGNGALHFDNTLLAEIFSHSDAVVYINSVHDALAATGMKESSSAAKEDVDKTNAGETAAGDAITDTERAADVFADRTGAIGDVSTSLLAADAARLSGVQLSGDNPVILENPSIINPINNAPVFVDVPEGEEGEPQSYRFYYDENSEDVTVIGTVHAVDVDGDSVVYAITGGNESGFFEIDSFTGVISLTAAGIEAYTNDYEILENIHYLTVSASDGSAVTEINVVLNEQNVNEGPDAVDDTYKIIGVHGEYYGYAQGEEGDGQNLSNLAQIRTFIAANNPDATFIPTALNYGDGKDWGSLGMDDHLQQFLRTDAGSLNTDPSNTSDAIIRMSGFITLKAGSYNFKITSDDGYSILIDGQPVAEIDANQAPTTTVHDTFAITESGIHTIEIIYWDQAERFQFKAELSSDGRHYHVLNIGSNDLVTQEDTQLVISPDVLLANDTDPENDSLSITSVQNPVNGSVSIVNGHIVFMPAADYNGEASFDYTITDGNGGYDTATVYLNVTPVNDGPMITNDLVTINEDVVYTMTMNDFGYSDADGDTMAAVKIQSLPSNGTLSLNGHLVTFGQTILAADIESGKLIFIPTDHSDVDSSFKFKVFDGQEWSDTGKTTINITADADTPSLSISVRGGEITTEEPIFTNTTEYNLHTKHTTGVISLGGDAVSAMISVRSYHSWVDDGKIILKTASGDVEIDMDTFTYAKNGNATLVVDANGVAFNAIEITSSENSEFKVKGISAYSESSEVEYTLNIAAFLTDTDGSELLGAVNIDADTLPAGAALLDSEGEVLIPVDGFYSIYLTGGTAELTMTSDTSIPYSDINAISASVASTESENGDMASVTATAKIAIDGTLSNDTLSGTDADEIISGGAGSDTLTGGDGDDILIGGSGDDALNGGLGDDILISDFHTHTSGISMSTDHGIDSLDGGEGTDTLILTNGADINFGILNSSNNPLTNIEVIDLSLNGDHQLQNISHQDIMDITGGGKTLTILGDTASDLVSVDHNTMNYDGTATGEVNGVTYDFDIYTSGIDPTVTLRVESVITDVIA